MNCLFCSIAQGSTPAKVLFEDQNFMVFRDVNPQAPIHFLVIPKIHIATINDASEHDTQLIGGMILLAKKIAASEGLTDDGYRLVFNVNSHGGQTIYHIHLHVLGGRHMTWPPG